MQWPLQTPGGVELLVIGLIFLVPLAAFGVLLTVLRRATRDPPAHDTGPGGEADAMGSDHRGTDADPNDRETDADPNDQETDADPNDRETDADPDGRDTNVEGQTQPPERDRFGLPLSLAAWRTIDWVVGLCLFLLGLCSLLVGTGAALLADREAIADFVAREAVQTEGISEATFVDVTVITLRWGGIALALVGVLLVLAGLWFAVARLRLNSRSATETGSVSPTLSNALLGALVSLVAAAIPFSPALGGGAAGYLQSRDRWAGLRVGLLSGLALSLPVVIVFGAIATGLFVEDYVASGLVAASALVATLAYCLLLSGAGGFIGGYLLEGSGAV